MTQLQSIIGDYSVFLKDIISQVEHAGFDLADFTQLDHMCYRTVSDANYIDKKTQLLKVGTLLSETIVKGRSISTIRLAEPVVSGDWRVDCIELPAPKPDSRYTEGLEHVEFVLYDPIDVFLQKYPDKEFGLRAKDRGVNPEVSYSLGKYAVKFHILSLQTATYLEKKLGISEVSD